jgi:tetratricopeptide (TPR) repeat protein
MLPLASNSKLFAGLSVVALLCAQPAAVVVASDVPRKDEPKKEVPRELKILPPPGLKENSQTSTRELVEQVLGVDKNSREAGEVKLPAGVMGLQPGDLTGDPVAQSREMSRLKRTDTEISAVSGAGDFERKLGEFDRLLDVTEQENKPLAPSFVQATKKIREMFAQKRYEDALVEVNEVLLHYSASGLLWTMKGTLHLRMSQIDLSLAAYEKAFALEPNGRLSAQIEQLRRLVAERETLKQQSPPVNRKPDNSNEGRQP